MCSAAVGLSFMQFTNMNSMRNLFIIGVSLFLGLSIPEYFSRYSTSSQQGPAHTKAGWVRIFFLYAANFKFQLKLSSQQKEENI